MSATSTYSPPEGEIALSGPVSRPELGTLPIRGDLAHIALAGRYLVPHYIQPQPRRIARSALLRSATVWGIGIPFTVSSISAYAGYALLPPLLRETAGVGEAQAGALLALLGFLGLPLAALGPLLATRLRTPTPLLIASTALFTTAYGGLLLAPATATLLWMGALGLAYITFPMCLALFALRSRTPATASVVSGAVQGVGYAVAAVAPLLLGGLRDATGSWSAALVVLLVVGFGNLVAVPLLARRGTVDDEVDTVAVRR